MKKIIVLLLVLFAFTVYGADVKISNLPATTTLDDTDVVPAVYGTTTSKITVANLKTLFGYHAGVTLSTTLGANLLGLSTQQLTLDDQTANYVFAGPTTGEAAAPSFRALVAADIPSLVATYQPLNATLTALAAQTETAGSIQYYTDAATPAVLAKGTAYQLLNMNSGATAPTWTSTLGATGTRLTKIWATDMELTNLPTIGGAAITTLLQAKDTDLDIFAGITPSTDIQDLLASADYATALTNLGGQPVNDDLTTLSSGGTANCLWGEKSDSSGIECKTTINIQLDDSAAQFKSATASKGTLKFDQTGISDTKLVTVKYTATDNYTFTPTLLGNVSLLLGTTFTNSKYCTYSTSTGLTCNADGGGGTGDLKADGTVPMTAALIPNAANTIALGSTSAEWADIYLGDGAIIYGENDQSNTITSSATGWTFAKPIVISDVSNDNYIKVTNNTSRAATASVNELYPEGNIWKASQNGTEYSIAIGPSAEQINFSGTLTNGKLCSYATGGAITCNSDASGSGDVTGAGDCASGDCYDGSSDGGTYIRLYDGTSAYTALVASVRKFTMSSSLENSEDLSVTLGNNDNKVTVSSSTGVTEVGFSALNLVTTGTISGKVPMISKSGNYTLGTDNAQEAYGYMVWLTGDGATLTLPAVAAGMSVCVYSADSYDKVVDPNANDGIRNGTTTRNADGHSITSGATDQGSFVCLVGDSADGWTVLGKAGTWTDE